MIDASAELLATYLAAPDRGWEGSWAGHPYAVAVACLCDDEPGTAFVWFDGRPAIVINHGAALIWAAPVSTL